MRVDISVCTQPWRSSLATEGPWRTWAVVHPVGYAILCQEVQYHDSLQVNTPLIKFYQIDNTILDNVDSCTYLGILLTSDMSWSSHISSCAKKANARLGFLRRNLKGCPQPLKRMTYVSLLRSSMEYSSALWDPHLAKYKTTLENIQRRAARWIRHDYSSRSSVTAILSELGLD